MSRGAEGSLDAELEGLLAETNDQRRRAGQAFHHLYRSLIFWSRRDRTFQETLRAWSHAGAEIFTAQATTLRGLEPQAQDVALRRWLARVLRQLAGDVERGDHMLVPFLRWIEGRFPELTKMMQAETPGTRLHDYGLAHALAQAFGVCARSDRAGAVAALREVADGMET